jgi:hypothetical protein
MEISAGGMAVYKQAASKFWWYKFTWKGELIRRRHRFSEICPSITGFAGAGV